LAAALTVMAEILCEINPKALTPYRQLPERPDLRSPCLSHSLILE